MRSGSAGGGVADKLGNRYELAWAVQHALRCIQDERRSFTLEDLDPELADGSEFTFVDEHGAVSVTQVKRQNSSNDHWTIAALRSRGVFDAAARHVAAGRDYHFSSTTPCGPLRVLSEWARQSGDVDQFMALQLTKTLSPVFDELSAPDVFGDTETAWRVLRGMWFEVGDEQQLAKTNAMLASTILEGAPATLLTIAVGDVLLQRLRTPLARRELLEDLGKHEIFALDATAKRTARDEVHTASASWRKTVERELLAPPIPRSESAQLVELMRTTRLALVVGAAGGGKTSVAYQAALDLESGGAEVLAFRLDRRGAFSSTAELGRQLGLSATPVAALRLAADGRDSFLVIDQLDAVSLASGRLSNRYDVIADLIDEAVAVDGVRVILVCRLFDVENDHRIRKLDGRKDVERLHVGPLPGVAVDAAVEVMGLDPAALTPSQRELLTTPLNLVLLETIAGQPAALNFTSRGSLFEAFWERKRQTIRDSHPEARFSDVLARVANAASDQQSLSVDVEILDADDFIGDAQVLASEQVLAIDGGRVSFFHEAFFDYTFARQWLSRRQSLVEFLCAQEQELFRRAQVRQIIELLSERDPSRSRTEVHAVLTHRAIRYHIKETVMAVFANTSTPTEADLDLVLVLANIESASTSRLWQQIARPSWFGVFHGRGLVEAWLDSADPATQERGVAFLTNAGPHHAPVVVELLNQRIGTPNQPRWLQQVTQRADLHTDRPLFDLLLDAVRRGELSPGGESLWLSTRDLATQRPLWAIELLRACFAESSSALVTGDDGKISLLGTREYGILKLIQDSSRAEPRAFGEAIVPYLLDVMRVTAFEPGPDGLIRDRHFGFRMPTKSGRDDVDDVLYDCAGEALASWAETAPGSVEPWLRILAASQYDAAQALLFRALVAGASNFVDWAAELMLQGGARLDSGYMSNSHWLSREVVEAIAPLVSDEVHLRLEDQLRDLRNPYERGVSFGYTAFQFLTALDRKRLSRTGIRRLAEYQRKFGIDSPAPPTGIISYSVGSPIEVTATGKMSDTQWLRAMTKHGHDDRGYREGRDPSLGGARELSHVLKDRTAEDALRFARLAMRMTPATNPAYPCAVLWGFGEATVPNAALPHVFDAIRHIMSLGLSDCDRWLGWSLRRVLDHAPLDLIELVTDRALHSSNPTDDSPVITHQNGKRPERNLRQDGINTARGSLAEELGDLLVRDARGERTALVAPHLVTLASDPVLSVRACVAHTIAACLRHERAAAYEAFDRLIDTDDILLASDLVRSLMIYIGNVNPERIDPVIDRMLRSAHQEVRKAGGSMAAFAALQWERPQRMDQALGGDADIRVGAATVCSARTDRAANSELNFAALRRLMHDSNDEVRRAVGELAVHLKEKRLRPFASLLTDLITSPTYVHATPQLLIVLQEAPDKVDDLTELAAHRFLDLFSSEILDLRTAAAGDAHYISDLVIRGLAQTEDKQRVSTPLDIIDRLLELGVYGLERTLEHAERG